MEDELNGRCLFAIPKKGRLYDKCVKLLEKIDFHYIRKNRLDIAIVKNMHVALVFLPAADIGLYTVGISNQ